MVSWRVAPTVAVGVNRYFHEVRIVEGPGRRFERRIIKMPVWGPCFPEPPAEPAAVLFQRRASSLEAEVPLIPVRPRLIIRNLILRRGRAVTNGQRDEPLDSLRPQRRSDVRGSPAPIVAHQSESLNADGIRKFDQILAERGELAGSERGLLKKTRRSESSQVGRQRPIPRVDERSDDTVPGADVVGEAMDQDDGFRLRTAAVLVRDFQTTRSDTFRHVAHGPRIAGKRD